MLFRTQIIFCSSELRLHFRIAVVGSLLSLNRAWRAQVTLILERSKHYSFIQKKCSINKYVNYRPVSLTSVICKLLETIIRDHMMDFIVKHKLINSSQHGFLKASSCLTNLLCFFEEITKMYKMTLINESSGLQNCRCYSILGNANGYTQDREIQA